MSNEKIIPIFFATDDNYVPFLSVALNSMIKNASTQFNYHIHILNPGLSEKNKNALLKFNKGDTFKIFLDDMRKKLSEINEELPTRDYYTEAIFYRLFILYLDCDIALNGDISELFNIDISDNYFGAIADEAVSGTPAFIEYVENYLGVKAHNYFNSGILLMNLDILRKEKLEERFLDLLSKYKFIVAPDQDYLNVLSKNKVYYIPKIWNKMPIPDAGLTLADIKLVHYNLSFKPWHYDNILYDELFWEHAKQTDYHDEINYLKDNFTDELKQKDQTEGMNLMQLALERATSNNTFLNLVNGGKIVLT